VFWPQESQVLIRASDSGEFPLFFNHHVPATGDPFLTVRVLGDRVPGWVERGDGEAVESVMNILSGMFGPGLPEPEGFLRSNWFGSPFTQCGYSVAHVGVPSYDHRTALSNPVARSLVFAGEHTHPDYPSTVHGALLSGQRAAGQFGA